MEYNISNQIKEGAKKEVDILAIKEKQASNSFRISTVYLLICFILKDSEETKIIVLGLVLILFFVYLEIRFRKKGIEKTYLNN